MTHRKLGNGALFPPRQSHGRGLSLLSYLQGNNRPKITKIPPSVRQTEKAIMAYKQRSLSMNNMPSFDDLSTDELAHILGFLAPKDIMGARLNNKMREAAKKAIVPMTDFQVYKLVEYNAMAVMTRALPNLQQITINK
jgi:hypothetical protein